MGTVRAFVRKQHKRQNTKYGLYLYLRCNSHKDSVKQDGCFTEVFLFLLNPMSLDKEDKWPLI
jgi:hypothetical protein